MVTPEDFKGLYIDPSWSRLENLLQVARVARRKYYEENPPDIPTEFKDKIMAKNGCDLKLVIQKKLSKTDMKGHYARLSIPKGQMRAEFLSEEDQITLQQNDGIRCKGMEVLLIQPSLEESYILLKKWKSGSSLSYVLSSPWNEVATKNGLKSDDIIQLWSFKVEHKLCLALIKLDI